ncbi:Transcription initiation factor TFIID subunit-like protein [Hapsidospora chrysogenum ATCC 11550]|uniref:Transcription initiation factor TFIID subunit-like protein n=1 Tax=Hapsidospora chrysogenum (strain ATCC 11550 / CBS 779.69 / DSM 880 / IAM 14645 / JCM 23072 / IMI 49137) TaxID=857340 RepID=A0A086T2C1_HAPC1|nr:Transcription initiation factor TFIID subunit-like protein [Hapsidospora chrysogenum ATCC 11550]
MASSQPQTNGVPTASVNGSQTVPNTQATQATQATTATSQTQGPGGGPSSTSVPRPRDARLIELLLTSQGVTSYEQRVPLQLLDFAYRHSSSILNDAIHLSGDPYITQAGAKPSASSGATAAAPGDATVTANAVKLAISARLSYQFRGGSTGGGISKEYMQELARERNKVSLPRIVPNEWGVRLPSERFVLSGTSWGLKDMWEEEGGQSDEDEQSGDAMEGIEAPPPEEGGDPVEGGTMDDIFGDDVDEEMAEEG